MKGKVLKLKENMFPMMVLEKLVSRNCALPTQSFFVEFDKTNNHITKVIPRNIEKWKLQSIRLRLRQMKFRGLVDRENIDLWSITPLGKSKLLKKKEKLNT